MEVLLRSRLPSIITCGESPCPWEGRTGPGSELRSAVRIPRCSGPLFPGLEAFVVLHGVGGAREPLDCHLPPASGAATLSATPGLWPAWTVLRAEWGAGGLAGIELPGGSVLAAGSSLLHTQEACRLGAPGGQRLVPGRGHPASYVPLPWYNVYVSTTVGKVGFFSKHTIPRGPKPEHPREMRGPLKATLSGSAEDQAILSGASPRRPSRAAF